MYLSSQVELMRMSLEKECEETRTKITSLTDNEYAVAKADVDRLRQELGQPPLPSLQTTLEEKTAQYLTERRLNGNGNDSQAGTPGATAGHKRGSASLDASGSGDRKSVV